MQAMRPLFRKALGGDFPKQRLDRNFSPPYTNHCPVMFKVCELLSHFQFNKLSDKPILSDRFQIG
jgi:hypothetical protein